MIGFYIAAAVILLAAGLLALSRIERGPSMFDRILGLDVTTAVLIGMVTVVAAATKRTDLVPVLIVLALVGFIGSTAIARFAAAESAEEGRILTREEMERILAERKARSDADEDQDEEDEGGTVIVAVDDMDGPELDEDQEGR